MLPRTEDGEERSSPSLGLCQQFAVRPPLGAEGLNERSASVHKRLLDTTTGYSMGVTRFRVVRTQCPFILFSAAPGRPSLDCSFERQIPGQWT